MTSLEEFIDRFDKDRAVVLLEGKGDVLEADKGRPALGRLLASKTAGMTFRSGNTEGSDGVSAVSGERLQVITPYTGHRQKTNRAYDTISLDETNIAAEPEAVYRSGSNRRMKRLIDQLVSGGKNRYAIKAAYIIRDTVKAMGTNAVKPATVGIFYDDLASPRPVGQRVWLNWLTE